MFNLHTDLYVLKFKRQNNECPAERRKRGLLLELDCDKSDLKYLLFLIRRKLPETIFFETKPTFVQLD